MLFSHLHYIYVCLTEILETDIDAHALHAWAPTVVHFQGILYRHQRVSAFIDYDSSIVTGKDASSTYKCHASLAGKEYIPWNGAKFNLAPSYNLSVSVSEILCNLGKPIARG